MEDFEDVQGQDESQNDSPNENLNLEQSDNQSTNDSTNPAWNDFLEGIPEEFHNYAKGKLSEWDKGVQNRFQTVQQQFSPYKDFIDNNVPVEDLNYGLSALTMMRNDPEGLYNLLAQQYNFGQNSSQGQQSQEQEDDEEDFDVSGDITKHPAFREMQERNQKLENWAAGLEQREAAKQQEYYNKQAESDLQREVEEVKRQFPNADINFIATQAYGQFNSTKQIPSLIEVAQGLAKAGYIQPGPAPRASDGAPPVVKSGNGPYKEPSKKFGDMTDEEREAYIMQAAGISKS